MIDTRSRGQGSIPTQSYWSGERCLCAGSRTFHPAYLSGLIRFILCVGQYHRKYFGVGDVSPRKRSRGSPGDRDRDARGNPDRNAHGFERVLQLPDIAEAKAGSACEEIRAAGRRTFNVAGDLKDSSKFNKLLEKTIAEFGSIDRLVKNASVILRQNIRWSIRTK